MDSVGKKKTVTMGTGVIIELCCVDSLSPPVSRSYSRVTTEHPNSVILLYTYY